MHAKLLAQRLAHGEHPSVIIILHIVDDVIGLALLSPQYFCWKKKKTQNLLE